FAVLAVAQRRVMLDDRPATGAGLGRSYAAVLRVLRIGALAPLLAAGAIAMGAMVGVYTGIELLGLVSGPGQLLALRASALPVMVVLPLIAIPLGHLTKPTQMTVGVAVAAAAMAAAALVDEHL